MAQNPPYFNSNESWATDPNCLFAEDFEEVNALGGHWYYWNREKVENSVEFGGMASTVEEETKGWQGVDLVTDPQPEGDDEANAGVGGGWCGSHGNVSGGANSKWAADHNLFDTTRELHVRWYQKWLTGYSYGWEKVLTFNMFDAQIAGIWFGNIHVSAGDGSDGHLMFQPAGVTSEGMRDVCDFPTGEWICIEVHIKLSTNHSSADGQLRVWADACGTDGTSPPGSQTLQYQETGMNFGQSSGDPSDEIGSLWWEMWANPASTGETYIDQIVVLDGNNQIGFFDAGGGESATRRGGFRGGLG